MVASPTAAQVVRTGRISGENKYENQGGPGIQDILRVLDTSSQAAQDKRAFVKAPTGLLAPGRYRWPR
jgi:hypothetical protein